LINVGAVGVVSCHGRFLQAYDDGEMHASKSERSDAETWILWQMDWSRRTYAIQNKRTGLFLSKCDVKSVVSNKTEVGLTEKWTLINGDQYHVPGRVAFRAFDGTIMGSHPPGIVTGCGGEIMAADRPDPSVGAKDPKWPGWFSLATNGRVVLVEDGLAPAEWSDRGTHAAEPAKRGENSFFPNNNWDSVLGTA